MKTQGYKSCGMVTTAINIQGAFQSPSSSSASCEITLSRVVRTAEVLDFKTPLIKLIIVFIKNHWKFFLSIYSNFITLGHKLSFSHLNIKIHKACI